MLAHRAPVFPTWKRVDKIVWSASKMAGFLYIVICATAITQMVLVAVVVTCLCYRLKTKINRVGVVVLGDIGRSPRMQYHVASFVNNGFEVDLIGYPGSKLITELRDNERVFVHHIADPSSRLKALPRLLLYIVKTLWQASQLFYVLLVSVDTPSHLLIQNPPAIPTLAVAWFVCCVKGSYLVVDWHNYGYTILALSSKNKNGRLVRFAKWYEGVFGQFASKNLCVTSAMKNDLAHRWGITANVLYDCPADFFTPLNVEVKHEILCRLNQKHSELQYKNIHADDNNCGTVKRSLMTVEYTDGKIKYNDVRPAFIVSSTSWTDDEDFSIFLSALEEYNGLASCKDSNLPDIVCAITGKGPKKEYYKSIISQMAMEHVTVFTPWLEPEDYPKLLELEFCSMKSMPSAPDYFSTSCKPGCADFGVCLHSSSSGLDLPMKVVDMFGCGLPVCALNFNCLDELVKHDENGLVFNSSKELCNHFKLLLTGFPSNQKQLTKYRSYLIDYQSSRWETNWQDVVLPLFREEKPHSD